MSRTDERIDVTWARVDDGFYVGSRPGVFLGCVDARPDGMFVAMDVHTQPLGTFSDLRAAMRRVSDEIVEPLA